MDSRQSEPEVEAKLALPGPVYWRLYDDPSLLGLAAVSSALERQANLFYDGPDGQLRRAGVSLRARRIAGRSGVEWTLKSGRQVAGAVQSAEEMVAWGPDGADPLAAAEGVPPVAAARRLASGPLIVDAASSADRLLLEVAARSGGVIGVSLDRLRIPGDAAFVDYELEAEAHGAARADVEALAADVMSRFGLSPSTDSKRARIQAYADGRLGPPRVPAASCSARLAELARPVAGSRRILVAVGGLTGSPISHLVRDVERELSARAIACEVLGRPDDWSRADLRLWAATSVHWRSLRYLRSKGEDVWEALRELGLQTAADRRDLEWRWREADLVALADETSVHSAPEAPSAAGTAYSPDDLAPEIGGQATIEQSGSGSRLTFVALAWPADLASARHAFDVAVPAERVAAVLREVGYERSTGSTGAG